MPRSTPPAERIRAYSAVTDKGCWEWQRYRTPDGYGRIKYFGQKYAHRVSYETFVGPIPDGLSLDHRCRNRCCVNPDHLEPVSSVENTRRGVATRTHCKRGHEYTEANTAWRGDGRRKCRACCRENDRRYRMERTK